MGIKVLCVDDSALIRQFLRETLTSDSEIELCETAHDPHFAIEKMKKVDFDLLILDIEMPRMDGITFLQRLMRSHPIPSIIFSSLTDKNAELTIKAFEIGAFEVLLKPTDASELVNLKDAILRNVKSAAKHHIKSSLKNIFEKGIANLEIVKPVDSAAFTTNVKTTDKLIAIGASTGGTVAITEVLKGLPIDIPGIVIVQHMPEKFTTAFAARLNSILPLTVKEAADGDAIRSGCVYIAPGGIHCSVKSSGAKYMIVLRDAPPVNFHRPSVSVLFNSVANYVGKNALGVMLTGMGNDGARAMREMKEKGSYNIVQDEASSIVWGMPGKAVAEGAEDEITPLSDISRSILRVVRSWEQK